MGSCSVHLSSLYSSRTERREWFPLKAERGDGSPNIFRGQVLLALRWVHNPELLSARKRPVDFLAPPFEVQDDYPEEKLNELHILLIKATGLKVMDKNFIGKGGSSDPVVTFSIVVRKQMSLGLSSSSMLSKHFTYIFPFLVLNFSSRGGPKETNKCQQ